MALSAADLQRRHALEGAPDPFPSLADSAPANPRTHPSPGNGSGTLDTDSHDAFPSLAPAAPAKSAAPAWGSAGPRIKPSVSKQPVFADSFTLPAVDLSAAGKDGRPSSLGEIMKQVMAQHKVRIEASTNQRLKQTTVNIKAEHKKDLDKAKRALLALFSPVVTLVLNAPASTIASLIGPKGATLKQIRDQTGVKVDIPKRDPAAPSSSPPTPTDDDEEPEEPTVPVSITGPQPLAAEAYGLFANLVAARTSHTTQRVRAIPPHVLPFLRPRRSVFEDAAAGEDITLTLNADAYEIVVSGERGAVARVIDTVKSALTYFETNTTSLTLTLPKRQHRLLTGAGQDTVMAQSRCAVLTAAPEDSSEEVTIWGRPTDLSAGVAAVMEVANSAYIHEFPLPGPPAVARRLLAYMHRVGYAAALAASQPGVAVYVPAEVVGDEVKVLNVDIVGEKPAVDAAVRQVSELIGKLIGATRDVQIDWIIHRIINSHKNAKKIKAFHEAHNVLVYFPPEEAERSSVLLVYDPATPGASLSPVDKAASLETVEQELLKMAREAADVKTQTLSVEKKWHDAVVGRNGTTLNAIIGEDKTLSIKFVEDTVVLRGISADVDRAAREIEKIVEDAKNDEIVGSFTTEFEIDREYVGRIVGAHGAGVNKLRDTLGVQVDFSDEVDEKEKDTGKKKKAPTSQKAKVKIVGRKENVEEAKKRIINHADRLADETSEVLKIPHQYHSSLIGPSGKYVIRLEDKYDVKITFPRELTENGEGKTREQLKPDEVLLKGGRKGVAGAKSEILDVVEYEKESNNTLKFTVPTRAVARILGRQGASINEIKDSTGAQIDVDKADDGAETHITVRGTKAAIAEAKAAILAISDQVGEETTATVTVENRFHRTLIGGGGQGLKDLIARVGGPTDPKVQAGLIRFPRQGEPSDEVRLRGEPKLVAKLQAELEKTVATLRDRVVLGMAIPAAQHRAFIGRGGQHLSELQTRLGVQVQFPGSRSFNQVGEPENAAELTEIDAAELVKVSGARAACEKAVEELKAQIKAPAPDNITATVTVPLKYHHTLVQQGSLLRTLRQFGVQVEQSALPSHPQATPHPSSEPADTTARIDDAEDPSASVEAKWEVVPNYQGAEDGEAVWTLKARDAAGLERAQKLIGDALARAEKMTHVGFLTLADRSVFPRIVGAKGATVARLRAESGADITVGRDDSTIVIVGSEEAIGRAKELILKMSSNHSRGRRDA